MSEIAFELTLGHRYSERQFSDISFVDSALHFRKTPRESTIFRLFQRMKVPVNTYPISDDALCVSNYVWLKETLISKKKTDSRMWRLVHCCKMHYVCFRWDGKMRFFWESGHLMLFKKSNLISKENLAISWFRLFISVVEAFDLAIVSVLQGNMDY